MSYLSLGTVASAADQAAAEAQKWNEQYEAHAGDVDPDVKAYLEMRDKVFALADQLGIGQQVRTLYHTTAVGAKLGVAGGSVGAAIASGGALPAMYSGAAATGAAIGMAAGTGVGLVVALFSLFGGDDSDPQKAAERKARKEERARIDTYLASRLNLSGLIKEQQNAAATARAMKAKLGDLIYAGGFGFQPVQVDKAIQTGDALALLYQKIGQTFSPADIALFESQANIERWQRTRQLSLATFAAQLTGQIAKEQANFDKLLAARQKTVTPKSAKISIPALASKMSPVAGVFTGLVVVGSALAIFHMWRKLPSRKRRPRVTQGVVLR
jgi:hypothetical protein